MTDKASPNFTWRELTRSQAAARNGWSNEPDHNQRAALITLCKQILEPVRQTFGPVTVTSAFRSPNVNRQIGGSPTSQHCKGEAADIEVPGVPNLTLAKWIAEHLDFDQLILEFYNDADPAAGWVHVSYRPEGGQRRETLTARRHPDGRVLYSKGLPKP